MSAALLHTPTPSRVGPGAITLQSADRATLIGASGTGKSTLANFLLTQYRKDYPYARVLVLDTKPRWRGEYLPTGQSTRHLYRNMVKGDTIPGAMVVKRMDDWQLAWDPNVNPSRTVIVQDVDTPWQDMEQADQRFLATCAMFARRFFASQKAGHPSLLYIDEGHDFFHISGATRTGSDIVQKFYRAGREKGITTVAGFQRPVGLPLQLLTELNYCALFRINYDQDVKRLYEMGWPRGVRPPSYAEGRRHVFRLWREGRPVAPPFRLDID